VTTWDSIIKGYYPFLETKWLHDSDSKVYTFYGLVHGSDDYYYGLSDDNGKCILVSCVGRLENMGFTLITK